MKVKICQSFYKKLAVVIVVKETGTRCPHSQRLRRHGVSVAVVNENDYIVDAREISVNPPEEIV